MTDNSMPPEEDTLDDVEYRLQVTFEEITAAMIRIAFRAGILVLMGQLLEKGLAPLSSSIEFPSGKRIRTGQLLKDVLKQLSDSEGQS